MAEEQDQSQKTEQPTQKRLDDAREKGQLAASREVGSFLLFTAATLLVMTAAPGIALGLTTLLRGFLAHAATLPTDPASLGQAFSGAFAATGKLMLVPFLGFAAAAIGAAALQNGIVWSAESLKPKAERLSPLAGFKRLFSAKTLVEFLKNIFKILLVAIAGIAVLWPEMPHLLMSAELQALPLAGYMTTLCLRLLMVAAAIMAFLAGLDYLWQRFDFMKRMRMSRRDIQDEQKQSDGDPHIKARLRQMRMEQARQRMMADVPKATVVITNPTHVSVALRYDPENEAVPVVVAKGVDHMAMKIREVAKANGVPLMESPPLARALHKRVEIGQTIPEQHYKAVAEIIGYVMRLRRS